MEIKRMEPFLAYYEKTRQVTNKVVEVIPHNKINWSYMAGKFTLGDLVRHIAAIEKNVFAEVAIGNKPSYKGCGKELADGYESIVSYFNEMHFQSVEIFKLIPDESLERKIKSLDGREIKLGNFLRALVVHEIHHRGALCIYLNLLGIATPPIIGLHEEQVIQLSK
ncbi:MAG TPA: DinB family protein [Chitinophagales bacterium]|nr:DinB family protein [Chitinophagales bacterium]